MRLSTPGAVRRVPPHPVTQAVTQQAVTRSAPAQPVTGRSARQAGGGHR
jgi:hypothetical protein